jgi:hypothetical protein
MLEEFVIHHACPDSLPDQEGFAKELRFLRRATFIQASLVSREIL